MSARSPWSLRRRLLLGLTLLVAGIAVTTGVLTVAASHGQLVARLDQELSHAAERTGHLLSTAPGGQEAPPPPSDTPPPAEAPPPVTAFLPGQGAGALAVLIVDGETRGAGYVGTDGESHDLTDAQLATLQSAAATGRPTTVDLGGDLGTYRILREEVDDGASVAINGLSLHDVEATTTSLILTTAAVSGLGLVLAVLLGALIIRVAIRPLDKIADTAARVSRRPLESKVSVPERVPAAQASPKTEVGRVGLALNDLLERVETALISREATEDRLRRFVADASHELRTPLAVIRGYTDVVARAEGDDPAAIRQPVARISAEAVRMTTLVEDLLLLARLDEGEGLRTETVDATALVADAVADAHVAAPDHLWDLDLPEESIGVEVEADPQRLHQVIANLLSNARTHTPPGTTVQIGLRESADGIRLTVMDDGPGIPADAVDGIFERFRRADTSRTRSTGGAGLGLAIASSLVQAHGGTLTVESRPGRTCFTVDLPRTGPLRRSS